MKREQHARNERAFERDEAGDRQRAFERAVTSMQNIHDVSPKMASNP